MKLPNFLIKKNKLALVLHRNFLDCYLVKPGKDQKPTKLGTLAYGSENAQFGEVYSPQALAKELNSFISAKKPGEFVAYLILSPELVFSVKNQEALAKIPLKKDDLLILTPQSDEGSKFPSAVLTVNKQLIATVKSAAGQLQGKIVGLYLYDEKTPELAFLQDVLYNAKVKSLEINL